MIYWLLTLWLPFLLDIADAKLLVKTQKSEIPPPAPASLTVERMRNRANIEERQARSMGYVWDNFRFSYDVGCQEGSPPGIDYDGIANMTTDGFPCVVWSESDKLDYPDYDLGSHNQCRNPNSEAGGVWCYTEEYDAAGFQWGYCPVPRCPQTFLSVEAKAADWNPPRASTPLPDQFNGTSSWTLCASFSIDEWSDAETFVFEAWNLVYSEKHIPGKWVLAYLRICVSEMNAVYIAQISPLMQLQGTKEVVLFPGDWVHACVSKQQIDNTQAKMQLVVGGDLLGELVGISLFGMDPSNFSLFLGEADDHPKYNQMKHRSKRTNVNMFSSALPVQRMVGMTKGGGEDECGEAGDLLSWTEVNWEVENNATMMQLTKDFFGSCRKESSLSVFNLVGKQHRVEDCMQQCG